MNIGILIGSKKIGGSERQSVLLAKGLLSQGHTVVVYVLDRPFRLNPKQEIDFSGVKVRYLCSGTDLYRKRISLFLLIVFLRIHKVDVLHLFNVSRSYPFFEFNIGKYLPKLCIVGGVRNMQFTQDKKYCEALSKFSKTSYGIICNAEAIALSLSECDCVEKEKTWVINNGIDISSNITSTDSKLSTSEKTVLFVGSLIAIKNPMCFIESAILLLQDGREIKFILAGDGPLKGLMKDRCLESGYNESFEFLGHVNACDIPFVQAKVLVSTAFSEGNSNAILEALSWGVPVVATAVGGAVEVIGEEEFGSLIETSKPDSISDSMQKWIDCPETSWGPEGDFIENSRPTEVVNAIKKWIFCSDIEWNQASNKAKEYISDNFGVKSMISHHLDVYNLALKAKKME